MMSTPPPVVWLVPSVVPTGTLVSPMPVPKTP
jgi:hypothetical protein